ncbi:TM2 domain-containing protein [Candidatus Hepatincolaceae symbiont of Richtersius coronifer]
MQRVNMFCNNCGKELSTLAISCTSCGHPTSKNFHPFISEKNNLIAFLLAIFLGSIGVHRFYVGKIGTGLIMLILTITILGYFISLLWSFIDIFFIIFSKFTDIKGKVLMW